MWAPLKASLRALRCRFRDPPFFFSTTSDQKETTHLEKPDLAREVREVRGEHPVLGSESSECSFLTHRVDDLELEPEPEAKIRES